MQTVAVILVIAGLLVFGMLLRSLWEDLRIMNLECDLDRERERRIQCERTVKQNQATIRELLYSRTYPRGM